jgi:hypothetical protein
MIVHGVTDTALITLAYNMLQMPVDRNEVYIKEMVLVLLLFTIFDCGHPGRKGPFWKDKAHQTELIIR